MADSSRTMRLVAQVVDQFSGPIRDMQRALNQMTEKEGKSNRDGARATIAHNKALAQLHKDFKNTGETVRSFFQPIMGELGVTTLGVASAMAAASKASIDFANSARTWGYLQEKTNLTVETLREFEALAPRVNSSAEQMDKGFVDFAATMDQFRQNRGDLMNWSQAIKPSNELIQFFGQLKATRDQGQALALVLKELTKIQSEPERETFLKLLGLDTALAVKTGKDLQKTLEQIRKRIHTLSPEDLKNGRDLADKMSDIRDDFNGMATDIGADIAPGLKQILTEMDGIANSALFKGSVKSFFDGLSEDIKGEAEELESFKKAAERLWDWFQGHKTWAPQAVPGYGGKNAPWHKSSYEGSGFDPANIVPASFRTGGVDSLSSSNRAEMEIFKAVFLGTMRGTLEAFKAWRDQYTGAGGGLSKVNYEGGSAGGYSGGSGGSGVAPAPSRPGSGRDATDPAAGGKYKEPNSFFDAIIKAEGTGKRGNPYDTSLGYLKSPKPLSQMTIGESLSWGDYIRHHTHIGQMTNSSAKGAFQIVNTTEMAAVRALGMKMRDKFDAATQQRVASWIAHHQGIGAWEGFKIHPQLAAQAAAALRAGEDLKKHQDFGLGNFAKHSAPVSEHRVKGEATMKIDLRGAPKHAKAHTIVAGGLFKEIKLNRGKSGAVAEDA